MKHPFTDEELTTIFEAALIGLSDDNTLDSLAKAMDLSDDEVKSIQEKLEIFMSES